MKHTDIKCELEEQAQQILDKAKERGLESDFMFRTTFERYLSQMETFKQLQEEIDKQGVCSVSPRTIRLYNSTASSANGTAATLINIVKKLNDEAGNHSKLQDFLEKFREEDE